MRITQFRNRPQASSSRIIASPKCETAIHARNVLLRDAIIQASLDPAVYKIELVPLPVPDPSLALKALVVDRDGQRLILDHRPAEAKEPRTIDDEGALLVALDDLGLQLVELDPREIRKEPRFTNCREVWRHHRYAVPIRDRLEIMQVMAEDGPQRIRELESRVSPTINLIASVCSLACSNILELELNQSPLGPRTIVRERR
jgi:hypothetical protein